MRILLIAAAALLVASGSGYYLLHQRAAEARPTEGVALSEVPATIQVYVPAVAVSAGTLLAPDHLARMPVHRGDVTDEMIIADDEGRALVVGSVARQALPRGLPIARSAIVHPGDRGFLAAVLPQGKRAISIPIGEVAGVSGLVMPGDRVDIILTYLVPGAVLDSDRDVRASETVLANLRVLALDQRLQEAASAGVNPVEEQPLARTATLEVTPQQAEMLTLATQLGELSLVLNSVADGGEAADAPVANLGAIAAAVGGLAAPDASRRRAMTVDWQVTSLLQGDFARSAARDGPASGGGVTTAIPNRVSRVQVVRGIESRAFELSRTEPDAPAAPGDPDPRSARGGQAPNPEAPSPPPH